MMFLIIHFVLVAEKKRHKRALDTKQKPQHSDTVIEKRVDN
jgi:hypothetical protein